LLWNRPLIVLLSRKERVFCWSTTNINNTKLPRRSSRCFQILRACRHISGTTFGSTTARGDAFWSAICRSFPLNRSARLPSPDRSSLPIRRIRLRGPRNPRPSKAQLRRHPPLCREQATLQSPLCASICGISRNER